MAKEIKFNVRISVDGKEQLVTVTSTVSDLRQVMDKAKGCAGQLHDTLLTYTQTVQTMQNVSNAVMQLTNTLNSVTEESRTFGKAMKAANTMAGKDAEDFGRLKDQIAELSKTIPMAREELANGLYQVISNGVPEDNWLSYLEASSKPAVGGIADVSEVVKVTSTIIKNYGLEWSAAQDIQDKIQLTAKNGAPAFEQLGVSFTETRAVMSTLTGVTGNTAEVATQLGSALTALTKETEKARRWPTLYIDKRALRSYDLLENNYLCSINNNPQKLPRKEPVVIWDYLFIFAAVFKQVTIRIIPL